MSNKDLSSDNNFMAQAIKNTLSTPNTWDKHTNRRIGLLHPLIRRYVALAVNELEKEHNIFVRVSDGLRDFDEQDRLYGSSRTSKKLYERGVNVEYANPKGSWRTNAKGGESFHNYGLAVDLVEIRDGKAHWGDAKWDIISEVFKKHGFEWLFEQIKKDKPHFQMTFGYTWKQLAWFKKEQNKEYVDFSKLI